VTKPEQSIAASKIGYSTLSAVLSTCDFAAMGCGSPGLQDTPSAVCHVLP